MYIPAHFEEPRPKALHDLTVQNPFGMLVTHGEHGLDANHTPSLLLPGGGKLGVLHAHMARASPVWEDVTNGDEVLVIFRAGDACIPLTWYPSKREAHRQASTWNYRVAHTHGRITVRGDERFVRGVVARLTRTYEASQSAPWRVFDVPSDYTDALLKMIVDIGVEITHIEGKLKLSQNRETRDIVGAGGVLRAGGEHVIGDAMLAYATARME